MSTVNFPCSQFVTPDVVERLRASQKRAVDHAREIGLASGRHFASSTAEVENLEYLETFQEEVEQSGGWLDDRTSAYSPCERLFFGIYPDDEGDRDAARKFWEAALDRDIRFADKPDFLEGFVDGALELWGTVQTQL